MNDQEAWDDAWRELWQLIYNYGYARYRDGQHPNLPKSHAPEAEQAIRDFIQQQFSSPWEHDIRLIVREELYRALLRIAQMKTAPKGGSPLAP